MIFFDILYNIIIYPIEFIIEILFYLFNNVFKSSYAVSLFLLSLSVNFLSLPLYNIAESWQSKERTIQDKMKPMIDNIKSVYKGDQRYLLIRACQRINGYKTIYAFRGTLGLLIQIPFFIAAYNFIHHLSGLSLGNFLFIEDFSKQDSLLRIGNFSINVLPFIMTLFSLLSGLVYSKKLKFKESLPLYIVSLIFLILLYNSPSGLLYYWTINCLFSLIKNIVIEHKLYLFFIKNRSKLLKAYNVLLLVYSFFIIVIFILSNIERKGYLDKFVLLDDKDNIYTYSAEVKYYSKLFRSSDLFGVYINTHVFSSNNIKEISFIDNGVNTKTVTIKLYNKYEYIDGNIELYYKLYLKDYSINILILMLLIFIFFHVNYIFNFIFSNPSTLNLFLLKRKYLIIVSCLTLSILSGLFIPSSLIGDSPQEFKYPFYLIFNDLSMSIGIFLFYPIFIYILFSERIKNYLTLLSVCLVFIVLINTFIMTGNYVNINSDFVFDDSNLLKASFIQIFVNIVLLLIITFIIIFFLKKHKEKLLINVYTIIIISLLLVSIFNISKIIKSHKELRDIYKYSLNENDRRSIEIFNISKTGENIFVFILDRAVSSYFRDMLDMFPDYNEKFDGFTYFPNNVSLGQATVTIGSLYGGYDYLPYEVSTNGTYDIMNFHNNALLTVPLALEKYGYKSTMLEPTYANFYSTPDLRIFKDYTNIHAYNNNTHVYNNTIEDYSLNLFLGGSNFNIKDEQKNKIIRFSIFRMLPINLRYNFYDNSEWFLPSSIIMKRVNSSIYYYSLLYSTKRLTKIVENGKYYNILHNMITHEPNYFREDFLPHSSTEKEISKKYLDIYGNDSSTKHFYANVASINVLIDFFNFLKENGVYDNTKIIIISDHSVPVNTSSFPKSMNNILAFNALLVYKDFNSRGKIKIDTNFMTIADMPYLATKHISNIKNPFNNKIITNSYKKEAYLVELNTSDISKQFTNRYNFDRFYYVKDDIFNIDNWKKFEIDWNTKEIKELDINN